ncbi:MAG TPA: hypothetical protein VFM18_11815 [Methanosarcina sp.]|nr:hypothetical protein [Methanosarcina sp.]
MSYTPNFKDPRIIKRCEKALTFVKTRLSSDIDMDKEIGQKTLYKAFGSPNSKTSKYLRELLLTPVNKKYCFGVSPITGEAQSRCKSYVRNDIGVNFLIEQIRPQVLKDITLITTIVTDLENTVQNTLKSEFGTQLESGEFSYTTKEHRKWTPIQQIKKEHKKPLYASYGYVFEYDINSAAPSLLYQAALKQNPSLKLPFIAEFLDSKTEIRNEVSTGAEISKNDAKTIINSLFFGAQLHRSAMQLLKYDKARVQYLKEHEFLTGLRKDITKLWRTLKPIAAWNTKNKLSATEKARFYFQQEELVRNAVERYLVANKIKHVLEHDGWICTEFVETNVFEELIQNDTGYNVSLSFNEIENSELVSVFD